MFRVYAMSQLIWTKDNREKVKNPNSNQSSIGIERPNYFSIFVCNPNNEIIYSEFGINKMCPSTSEYNVVKRAILIMQDKNITEYELCTREERLIPIFLSDKVKSVIEANKNAICDIRLLIQGKNIKPIKLESLLD